MLRILGVLIVTLSLGTLVASPAKPIAKKGAAASTKRGPSNTKASCTEHGCFCDDLTRMSNSCGLVLNPTDSTPRNSKLMRECYLNMVSKRRDAANTKASCPVIEKASAQIEDLRTVLVQSESYSKDLHVNSSKGLEGFGMDLVGHLGSNHRTPASGN